MRGDDDNLALAGGNAGNFLNIFHMGDEHQQIRTRIGADFFENRFYLPGPFFCVLAQRVQCVESFGLAAEGKACRIQAPAIAARLHPFDSGGARAEQRTDLSRLLPATIRQVPLRIALSDVEIGGLGAAAEALAADCLP